MNIKLPYRILPHSFSITYQGILYLVMLILLSAAALNTSNNLLFIILATMISAFIVSSVVSRSSLKQVSLSLQVPENVFEGERVPVKVSIRNTKRIFPSFSICVEDIDSKASSSIMGFIKKLTGRKRVKKLDTHAAIHHGFHPSAYFPILRPGETHSELTVQSFPHRGLYKLEGVKASTRFPFGLFRHSERIGVNGKVLVYPSVKDISTYFHRLPFLPGLLEGMQKGHGENLFSIRPYMEGESARIIDWKATAKTTEMMSREFAREEEYKFCLILDTQTHAQKKEEYWEEFEKAVSLAASIAAHFIDRGAGIEFLTPYAHISHGTGMEHLYRILGFLATVKFTLDSTGMDFPLWDSHGSMGIKDGRTLKQALSDKVFKLILTSKKREAVPSSIRRSSHMIFFSEL